MGETVMELIPSDVRVVLLQNGAGPETDHVPVVKLFNPCGAATWLITEMDADGDTLFSLADLGLGFPELGYASLAEISAVRLRSGLGIERDLHFKARFPLSVYAEAAHHLGHITEDDDLLALAVIKALPAPRHFGP
jgi:hypothetical protein